MSISFIQLGSEETIASCSEIKKTDQEVIDDSAHSAASSDYSVEEELKTNNKLYNGSDVMKFFSETLPETVAETCLVNDNFILVKMPTACWKCTTDQEETTNVDSISGDTQNTKNSTRRRLSRFFNCKRCRRVSPIYAEPTACKNDTTTNYSQGIWTSDNDIHLNKMPTEMPMKCTSFSSASSLRATNENVQNLTKFTESSPMAVLAQNPIKTEILSPAKHFLSNKNKDKSNVISTSSDNHSQPCTPLKVEHYNVTEPAEKQERTPTRFQLNILRRLMVSLRTRSSKDLVLTKSKCNAMICKTYFIRWTKPPETIWHGYGIDPNLRKTNKIAPVRRCRSAIF